MTPDRFAPLRELVSLAEFAPLAAQMHVEDIPVALLAALLREHAEMEAHLLACTATCKPATGQADER